MCPYIRQKRPKVKKCARVFPARCPAVPRHSSSHTLPPTYILPSYVCLMLPLRMYLLPLRVPRKWQTPLSS